MTKKIRRDTWEASLPADVKLQILLESEQKELSPEAHLAKLEKDFGKPLPSATYYRMLDRLRKIRPELIAEVEAGKAQAAKEIAGAGMPALEEIRAKLGGISKRLDIIDRRQSFMDMQLQSISAGCKDAFVMYMNMRSLNRVIRNSAFVADALELTGDIPYPGRRDAPIAQIFNYLDRLDKSTEERVDKFLCEGFSGTFDRKGMTDVELFMLRLRLIWGCSLVNQLERDLQIPLSGGEEEAEALFQREVAPACLFVDFWKDVRQVWLNDVAVQIYHFGKFQTPYESTAAMSKRIMYYQQKQEQKPS